MNDQVPFEHPKTDLGLLSTPLAGPVSRTSDGGGLDIPFEPGAKVKAKKGVYRTSPGGFLPMAGSDAG